MASSFLKSSLITREFAFEWRNQTSFAATATHKYEGMWSERMYQPGQTVDVRLPNNVLIEEGEVVTGTDIVEHSVPLTLGERINATLNYNLTELDTEMGRQNFRENVIIPSVTAVVNKLNSRIANLAKTQLNLFTGDPTASLSTFAAFNKVNAVLSDLENACWVCETPFDESKPVKLPEKEEEKVIVKKEDYKKGTGDAN